MDKEDFSRHGIAVSLGESFSLGPIKQAGRSPNSASTVASVGYVSKLPPAVAIVPKEHIRDYAHGKTVNNYLIGNVLGEGSFAKVKEALHTLVGEKVAVKVIDKRKALQDAYVSRNFKREARLLQMVHHPNIIQLYEVIETDNSYYLVTELCSGGELMKHIYKRGHLGEDETRKYIRQIISAVDHLHKSGIIHRDLKVENLLLDSNMDIKLIDFGLSNEEYVQIDDSRVHCSTQCGSPAYAAPELLGHKAYGPEVDIWSIGVNMYAMLTGCLPYTVEPFNITALHAKILENKMNPIPETISTACGNLLHQLLTPNPESRITMGQLFQDPWLNEGHKLPFTPAPFPNTLTPNDINEDITEHMVYALGVKESLTEVTQELLTQRATSATAMYFLLTARLKRYNKDYQSSRVKKQHIKAPKTGEDISTTSLQASLNTKTDSTEEKSTMLSARRRTLPPSVLNETLAPYRHAGSTKTSSSGTSRVRHAPRRGWDTRQDIQLAPVRPPISLKRNSMQVHPVPDAPVEFKAANKHSAWSHSNPPPATTNPHPYSSTGSKNSLAPQKLESYHDRESSDELMFYQVGTNGLSELKPNTTYDSSQDLPLPPIARQTSSEARRRQRKIQKGTIDISTEMSVQEILIEILRVAVDLKIRSTEQSAPNTVKCSYKDITFTVTVTKQSRNTSNLCFQWLSGGDHASYLGICEDMLSRLHL